VVVGGLLVVVVVEVWVVVGRNWSRWRDTYREVLCQLLSGLIVPRTCYSAACFENR
jgi:hypothetical protein